MTIINDMRGVIGYRAPVPAADAASYDAQAVIAAAREYANAVCAASDQPMQAYMQSFAGRLQRELCDLAARYNAAAGEK